MLPHCLAHTLVHLIVILLTLKQDKIWELLLKKAVTTNLLSLPRGRDINSRQEVLWSMLPFANPLLWLNISYNFLKFHIKKGWSLILHWPKMMTKVLHICSPHLVHAIKFFFFFHISSIDTRKFVQCNEILCDMHGLDTKQEELSSLNRGCWFNSVVCVKCFY